VTAAVRPDRKLRTTISCRRRPGIPGFTLIELTIVIFVIGLLAVMASYTYRRMVDKARMTQAKTVLSHLFRTQTIYFTSNDRFTDNVAILDFDPVRYPYYIVDVVLDNGGRAFTGYARGVGPMAGDLWYITQEGNPTQDNTSRFR
jgi:prepilin-type N-terminal cleavage/methylation domain-containing protein